MPRWRHSEYDPWDDAGDLLSSVFAFVVLAPFFWFILPLAKVIAELPIALGQSLFSSTRWVEAAIREPSEIVMVWRTDRDHAPGAAQYLARKLPRGYENLEPEGAQFESMTQPSGMSDA